MSKQKMQDLAIQLAVAKTNLQQAKDACSALERELCVMLEIEQLKSLTAGDHRVTYVRQTRVKVDEAGLRKALGAKVYDKFTDKKLNRSKLEKALDNGEVDATAVSPYVKEEVGSPYILITERKKDEA